MIVVAVNVLVESAVVNDHIAGSEKIQAVLAVVHRQLDYVVGGRGIAPVAASEQALVSQAHAHAADLQVPQAVLIPDPYVPLADIENVPLVVPAKGVKLQPPRILRLNEHPEVTARLEPQVDAEPRNEIAVVVLRVEAQAAPVFPAQPQLGPQRQPLGKIPAEQAPGRFPVVARQGRGRRQNENEPHCAQHGAPCVSRE